MCALLLYPQKFKDRPKQLQDLNRTKKGIKYEKHHVEESNSKLISIARLAMAKPEHQNDGTNPGHTQHSFNATYFGIFTLFCYMVYFGEALFEKAKTKCKRYDELGGVVLKLDCGHGILAYAAGGFMAFIAARVMHWVLKRW